MPAPLGFRAYSIGEYLISLSNDDAWSLGVCQIDRADLDKLTNEFYDWSDTMTDVMVNNGLGDETLDDLWAKRLEYYYLCERMGHGSGFADEPWANRDLGTVVCGAAANNARQQGAIETYVGDDGRLYVI